MWACAAALGADLRQVAAFGDPRFVHTAPILAVSAAGEGRVRAVAGRSVWTWPLDGTRAGVAPLAGCTGADRAVFSADGTQVVARCGGRTALFTVSGAHLRDLDVDLGRPITVCGGSVWATGADGGLARIDADGHTTAVDVRGTVVAATCADGTPVVATATAVNVVQPVSGQVSPPIEGAVTLLGPAAVGGERRAAAVVADGDGWSVATVFPDTGVLVKGPPLRPGPPPEAVLLGKTESWAVRRGGGVQVVSREGPNWSIGPPVDGLDGDGGALAGDELLWVARGLRIDRFNWLDGRSPTASPNNRSAPPSPTRRATWFGADGTLYSRSDHELAVLEVGSGRAFVAAVFSPGAGRPAILADGSAAAPLGDRVEVIGASGTTVLRGRGPLLPADGGGWACAPERRDGIAVARTSSDGAELTLWTGTTDGARPAGRVEIPGVPRIARWDPDGAAVWAGFSDAWVRVSRRGSARTTPVRAGVPWDVAFARGGARWLVAVEASGVTGLGAAPRLEVRAESGKVLATAKLPWTGRRAYGFVSATLEVWEVAEDGTLALYPADLSTRTVLGTVPIRPLDDGEPPVNWSPDGSQVAVDGPDGTITVWER